MVDDDEIIKVHVHTNVPGEVLTEALTYGPLQTVKIENMRNQHTALSGKETEAEAGFGAAMESILYFAAMIAVNLAVMNLLPLPALDGGHVLFLLVNGIAVLLFKREIPSKYLNVINGIGFALLMALMLFVTFHDIVKLL